MEANQLPTTSGQHWFKEEGTEDWQPYYVTTLDGEGLICHWAKNNVTSRCLVSEMPAGQWAKAHTPDEGVDAWAVFKKDNEEFLWSEPCLPARIFTESAFICEPVTIYRKEKE